MKAYQFDCRDDFLIVVMIRLLYCEKGLRESMKNVEDGKEDGGIVVVKG